MVQKTSTVVQDQKVDVKQAQESGKYKGKIAIIRVRGRVGVREDIEHTLRRLKLTKPNHLVIYEDSPVIRGMINKAKDYITWGEVSDEFIKEIEKHATKEDENLYRLQPPRKGWGRRGIKYTYAQGGALGYRGKDIESLIERMFPNK